MKRGYVKLFRRSLEHPMFRNPALWHFWVYCLLKATHKFYSAIVGFQLVELRPGQFIFGRRQASVETGLSEQTVRTCLKTLLTCGMVTSESTHRYTVITVVNWKEFQEWKPGDDPLADQEGTQPQPTADHVQAQETQTPQKQNYSAEFLEFYDKYPVKKGKGAAFKAFKKARKAVGQERIIDGVSALLKAIEDGRQDASFVKYPATWLNQECWDDEYADTKKANEYRSRFK